MPKTMEFQCLESGARVGRQITVSELVIAGWTGRDQAAIAHHIAELEALGVKPPSATPLFYRVSADRLTTADRIQVVGDATSGEVEFILLQVEGMLWMGLGSDHTDRDLEAYDVAISKQACEKPVAPVLWPFSDVEDHVDALVLRSFIEENGARVLYQETTPASMLRPADLIRRYTGGSALADGTLMYCGTSPAIGGIRPSAGMQLELRDDRLGRSIEHRYAVDRLPRVS